MRSVVMSGVLAVLVAGCSEVPIDGLARAGWDDPVTMPPVGYSGDTWVDARGCIFFATGTGWVPYVGGNLKQVCKG